jgi:hypothetical protein
MTKQKMYDFQQNMTLKSVQFKILCNFYNKMLDNSTEATD